MNPKDRLQYALYLQRLHELFVIKENIAFQYQNAHYNKAAEQIDKVVDKCLDNNIKAVVDGTHNLETPNLDHVISQALTSQQKMLVKTKDKYIQNAVEQNTKEFTRFIQNRIEKENYSLQAKIQKEYEKKKYKGMPEEEAKKLISEKFKESARKRSKNIVKDALHTNQSQISWTYNVNNGMKYKVWMNGQSKSRVRYWHVRSKIQPVEIDDFFDIYGPTGHARMMYPGDLNGGAENVANCKCWLHYTNIAPSNLKKKGTIQINPNVNSENKNRETFSANTGTKGKGRKPRVSESTSSNKKEMGYEINESESKTDNKGIFTKIKQKITSIPNQITGRLKNNKVFALSSLLIYNKINPYNYVDGFIEFSKNQVFKVSHDYVMSQGFFNDDDAVEVINKWSGSYFKKFNEYLRGFYFPSDNEKIKEYEKMKQDLSELIDSTDGLNEPTWLFRGEKDVDLSRFIEGEEGEFVGFIASSFYKKSAKKFMKSGENPYLIKIKAKPGTKGIALDGDKLGIYKNQYEWLLNHGQKYRTLKVDDDERVIEIELI